jgi:2-dehydropantoate 2-reductase
MPGRTLIVGAGALGGLFATRLLASGAEVALATRSADAAAQLRASGLRVTGVGGAASVHAPEVAPLDAYRGRGAFDLILLATKAHEAIEVAPALPLLLAPGGTLLSIQNGGVAEVLATIVGGDVLLGGLSNVGATMTAPGAYEQRNAGPLVVGELAGGESERAERVRRSLARGIEARVTSNFRGAVWAKLLLNCSVTTLGAVAGRTMREYVASPEGRELFDLTYDETLAVARAAGARPERFVVDPIPPPRRGPGEPAAARDAWVSQVVNGYGDVKASMLQDLERGRRTEIDFVNGYAVDVGRRLGVPTPVNAAIVQTVHAIARGELAPGPALILRVLRLGRGEARGAEDGITPGAPGAG